MLDPASLIVLHTAMMWSCAVAFLLIQRVETGWGFPGHWPLAFGVMPMVMLIGGYAEQANSDGLRLLGFGLGFVGPALLADGVRLFLRLPAYPRRWIFGFALFSLGIIFFTLITPNLLGRVLVFQAFTAGIGVYGLIISRRLSPDDHPLGRRFIGTFGFAPVLAIAVHLGQLLVGAGPPDSGDMTFLVLAATAIGMIAAIGCVILVAERFAAQVGREARSDVLTGLATRRVFDRALDRALQQYAQARQPVSVILFDIDHFKSINDTHGHDMGDLALRGVADCARSIVRPSDILARLGGDEFAVLLPETGLADATDVARRVLERLRGLSIPGGDDDTIRLSGSFGVACAETVTETPQTLIKRADLALYEVKRRGRNGVEAQRFGVQAAPA